MSARGEEVDERIEEEETALFAISKPFKKMKKGIGKLYIECFRNISIFLCVNDSLNVYGNCVRSACVLCIYFRL